MSGRFPHMTLLSLAILLTAIAALTGEAEKQRTAPDATTVIDAGPLATATEGR